MEEDKPSLAYLYGMYCSNITQAPLGTYKPNGHLRSDNWGHTLVHSCNHRDHLFIRPIRKCARRKMGSVGAATTTIEKGIATVVTNNVMKARPAGGAHARRGLGDADVTAAAPSGTSQYCALIDNGCTDALIAKVRPGTPGDALVTVGPGGGAGGRWLDFVFATLLLFLHTWERCWS
jgi:hypothetical protein